MRYSHGAGAPPSSLSSDSERVEGYVPFYTVRCLLLHRAVVFGSFSPNLTALSGFLCTSFVPIKEGYLMSNVGWLVSWLRFAS